MGFVAVLLFIYIFFSLCPHNDYVKMVYYPIRKIEEEDTSQQC